MTTAEVAANAHFQERGFFHEVQVPESGPARYPRYGFQLSNTAVHTGPGPDFGAHNTEVLQDLLGLTQDEQEALRAAYGTSDRPVPASEIPR